MTLGAADGVREFECVLLGVALAEGVRVDEGVTEGVLVTDFADVRDEVDVIVVVGVRVFVAFEVGLREILVVGVPEADVVDVADNFTVGGIDFEDELVGEPVFEREDEGVGVLLGERVRELVGVPEVEGVPVRDAVGDAVGITRELVLEAERVFEGVIVADGVAECDTGVNEPEHAVMAAAPLLLPTTVPAVRQIR
jgi:hypothetical protein